MIARPTRSAFIALAGVVIISACTPTEQDSTSETPTDLHESADPGVPTGGPITPAEATDEDRTAAVDAALATMNVWIQGSTLEEQDWRAQINATMTQGGQASLATVWGYRVPDTAIAGEPTIQREDLGTIVVRVPTDYTSYDVTVVSDQDRWLTAEIRTADGQPA